MAASGVTTRRIYHSWAYNYATVMIDTNSCSETCTRHRRDGHQEDRQQLYGQQRRNKEHPGWQHQHGQRDG
jgi:hypothetical protein